uniref:Odontogenesis associated phosphoprotein n=1 Tax=Nannospalax galili TaxID=1026970 RepID=A0A8C6W197_NANGA
MCLVSWKKIKTHLYGQEVVTSPGSSPNNVNPTDCRIFTLTPPSTRHSVTRAQPITRIPTYTFFFPQRRPRVYPRFPNGPFLPPNCNHRFQFWPFYWPQGSLIPGRYFLGRQLQSGSSSEESREK